MHLTLLIEELLTGTRKFHKDAEGNESFTDLPPTSKELRAARMLTRQHEIIQGLERTLNTVLREVHASEEQLAQFKQQMQKTSENTDSTQKPIEPTIK